MLKKKIKEIIKKIDVFAQPATFRFSEQPEYASLTGGIVSIIMIVVFICIFANTVIGTINRQDISSQLTYTQEEDPSLYQIGTNNFMFAVGIQNADMNSGKKWFDLYFEQKEYLQGSKIRKTIPITLSKCKKDLWTKLKPSTSLTYDNLNLDTFLCPDQGTVLELQGKFSSDIFKFFKIGVKACTPTANRNCASSTQIQQFINTNEAFKFNFYFLNTIINEDSQDYLGSYIDTSNYFLFTPSYGVLANFYISSYSITTDNSILPWEQKSIDQGGISDMATENKNYEVKQSDYLKFYIRKSSLSQSYQRSFRKVDDCLSYIGGLFSTIVVLLFFLTKYNQVCYELSVAQSSFHYEKNTPIKSEEFNFFTFLGFVIYSFFDIICINLPWQKMKRIDQSLEQIQKQMDIRLIMKKILFSQKVTLTVLSQPKAKILHLQAPIILKEAQQNRKKIRFYDKLEEKFFDYKKIREEQKMKETLEIPKINNEKQKQKQLNEIIFSIEDENKNKIKKMKRHRGSNQSVESLYKNTQIKTGSQIIKKGKGLKIIKRKSFVQVINTVLDDKTEKEKELEQMIQEMKQNVKILEKESERGDLVSQKILDKLDPKIMKIIINHPEVEKQQEMKNPGQAEKESKAISFQNGEYQFGDNPNQNTKRPIVT